LSGKFLGFFDVEELFDTEYQAMANHFASMREVEYKRALATLKEQLAYAKDEKDVDQVEKLTTQVAAIEQERKVATQVTNQVSNEQPQADPEKFRKWKEQNEWFVQDKDLQEEAMSIGIGYSATHKEKTQEEVYDYVEKRIRKMYPEKFEGNDVEEEKIVHKSASVEAGAGTKKTLGVKTGKLSVGDLDEREKEVMKTFIKRGVLTQEKYLEDLAKARGL
jgi:hypothetical protein